MAQSPRDVVFEAIRAGNVEAVRQQLKARPELVRASESEWLYDAASYGFIPMTQMLVEEFGLDVNCPRSHADSDRPLCAAAYNGCVNMARWLLEHGADVNGSGGTPPLVWAAREECIEVVQLLLDHGAKVNIGGGDECTPLASAATSGSLAVARLLLEQGEDPNVLYGTMEYGDPPTNALKQALMFGHQEVAALLRAHGAVLPPGCDLGYASSEGSGLLQHIERHLGKPTPLSLHEIVPGDPPVTVNVVPMLDCLALVTTGMSDRAMNVPKGAEGFQFAELVICLPADWPVTENALENANNSWPIDWLRRIAHYPHDNHTWLSGPFAIIANGDPPKPLAPNTQLTGFLILHEPNEFGLLHLPDGRRIVFYTLHPVYTEEQDLERQKGIEALLVLFLEHQISKVVNAQRPNAALARKA
jgi:hypothetical protein